MTLKKLMKELRGGEEDVSLFVVNTKKGNVLRSSNKTIRKYINRNFANDAEKLVSKFQETFTDLDNIDLDELEAFFAKMEMKKFTKYTMLKNAAKIVKAIEKGKTGDIQLEGLSKGLEPKLNQLFDIFEIEAEVSIDFNNQIATIA